MRRLLLVALAAGACQPGTVVGGKDNGGGGAGPAGSDAGGPGPGGAGGNGGTGGAGPGDGPGAVPEGGGPPGGSCADDDWPQYGHDGNRTGTSKACIKEPLTVAWRWKGVPTDSSLPYIGAYNAIAAGGKFFVMFAAKRPEYDWEQAFLSGVDSAGKTLWTWEAGQGRTGKGGRDSHAYDWPGYGLGQVTVAWDGLFSVDPGSGDAIEWIEDFKGSVYPIEHWDYWGQVLHDGTRVYAFNHVYGDGPPATLRAFVPVGGNCRGCGKRLWTKQNYASGAVWCCGNTAGGIALDGGVLYHVAKYVGPTPQPGENGLYAFDSASGSKKWQVAASASSHISAWGSRVYLVDGSSLVAFSGADGSRLWTQSVGTVGGQAPVIAPGGRIILASSKGVQAFDSGSGTILWTASVAGSVPTSKGKSWSGIAGGKFNATSVAVAGGNSTVVVTGSAGVTLLDLETGKTRWSGGGVGAVKNPIVSGPFVIVTDGKEAIALKSS